MTEEEIAAIGNTDEHPGPRCESKAEDWGRLDDGRVVMLDYGYAYDNEEAILEQRAYCDQFPPR